MNRLGLLIAALALAVLGAIGIWWWQTHERVEEWIDLPQRGEVTYNPLFVLKLALHNDGVRVQSRQRLQLDETTLHDSDTLLLLNDPRALSPPETQALSAWVQRGGHLIIRTPPPGLLGQRPSSPLIDDLIHLRDAAPACEPLLVAGEDSHVEFCAGRRFSPAHGPGALLRKSWGEAEAGLVYARYAVAAGSIDILADLDFLTNDKLRDVSHIVLTRQLLAPNYRDGTVHLVYDAQMPSLWALLLRYSWMAWLPLVVLLAVWLWRRMQRFGPLLPAPADERRSLLEHIVASGEHSYRYGYAHLLHAAARSAFLARLRRRDPQAAALDGAAQVALIAQRFNRPHAEIRDALATPVARDHAAFRSRIATLIRLRNQL